VDNTANVNQPPLLVTSLQVAECDLPGNCSDHIFKRQFLIGQIYKYKPMAYDCIPDLTHFLCVYEEARLPVEFYGRFKKALPVVEDT
jgi:hypothetical protein